MSANTQWGTGLRRLVRVMAVLVAATGLTTTATAASARADTAATRIVAWGGGDWGQLDVPEEARSGATDIAAGQVHGLALKDGGVIAWA
jgi:hypothetical protein